MQLRHEDMINIIIMIFCKAALRQCALWKSARQINSTCLIVPVHKGEQKHVLLTYHDSAVLFICVPSNLSTCLFLQSGLSPRKRKASWRICSVTLTRTFQHLNWVLKEPLFCNKLHSIISMQTIIYNGSDIHWFSSVRVNSAFYIVCPQRNSTQRTYI